MATVNPTPIQSKSTTAEDTLQRKSRDAGVISGGHLVAKALENEGGVPYLAVIGNNSAMNQIRYGQLAKYGERRGNVGNLLGDVPFGKFAEMLGGYGEEVRDPGEIAPALQRARESIQKTRRSAVVNIWVDPREYAPGTKNQTMYK